MSFPFTPPNNQKMIIPRSSTSKVSSSRDKSSKGKEIAARGRLKPLFVAEHSVASKLKRSSSLAIPALSSSSRSTLSSQRCASCGKPGVQLRAVTRSFGAGEGLLVIEGIPMWSCPHCGESYFTAQTMHEVERIKALRKSVAVDRSVKVAEFHG